MEFIVNNHLTVLAKKANPDLYNVEILSVKDPRCTGYWMFYTYKNLGKQNASFIPLKGTLKDIEKLLRSDIKSMPYLNC